MIQQKVKRIIYIDLIKGIAVFLVIWGHCIQNLNILAFDVFENQAFRFIYSFHMPLFMLISGYLFYFSINKYTTISLLSSRVKTLVIPAVSCGIITWLIQYILYDNRNVDSIFTEIRNVWFLWAVFIASILVGIIHIKFKEYKFHWVIHFIIFIALFLIPSVFIDYKSLYVYPYFIIGFMFNEFKGKNNNKLYNIRYFSLILYPLLLTMFHKNIFIYTTKINMFTSIYGIKNNWKLTFYVGRLD